MEVSHESSISIIHAHTGTASLPLTKCFPLNGNEGGCYVEETLLDRARLNLASLSFI